MLYLSIGIDPGKLGAVTVLVFDGNKNLVDITIHKLDKLGINGLIDLLNETDVDFCYLEKIGFRPVQAELANVVIENNRLISYKITMQRSVKRESVLHENVGELKGILKALDINFDMILPQEWQKKVRCPKKGSKKILQGIAQRLYPGIHIIQQTADSVLLAHCAMMDFDINDDDLEDIP